MRPKRLALAIVLGLGFANASIAQEARTVELTPGVTATITALKPVPGQNIVELDYEVNNNSSAPVSVAELGIGRFGYGLNEITLLDFPNEISFRVGVADQCLCTQPPEAPLEPGATLKAWAWFAPPSTNSGPFAVRFGATYPIMDVAVQ